MNETTTWSGDAVNGLLKRDYSHDFTADVSQIEEDLFLWSVGLREDGGVDTIFGGEEETLEAAKRNCDRFVEHQIETLER